MSRSSRKRPSKWDLSEEQQFEDGNIPDDSWMGKSDRSFHPKESGQEWHSPELCGRSASKWSGSETNDMQRSKRNLGLPTREPLPGSRSSHRNGSVSKGGSRYMEDSLAWGEDGNSSMRMSPDLEEWRQHRSLSPKGGYSRSQRGRSRSRSRSWTKSRSQSWSRSPDRGYRQEPIFLERSRSRSGFSAQVCKDFAVGRCRRGSDCQLLHEGNTSYDDSWDDRHRKGGASKYPTGPMADDNSLRSGRSSYGNDFVNGKSRREASSNYDNSRMSDGFSKGSANEIFRERDNDRERDSDRRRRDASSEQVADREPRRSNISCKFFAAGNCRIKNFCRFSHHIQSHGNSERWSQDERYGLGQNSNDRDQLWNGQKWNGVSSDSARLSPSTNTGRPRSGRWAVGQHRNDADYEWDDKKWSDTPALPESAKLTADNNRNISVQEQRSNDWSTSDNRWGHGQNNENEMCGDPSVSHDPVKKNDEEAQPWNEDKAGSKSKDSGKWLGAMSPDWKYTLPPSNTGKEEHGHIAHGSEISRLNDTSLNACKQNMSPDWNHTVKTSNNNREQCLHISLAPESSNLNNTSQKDRSEDIVQEASGQVYGGVSVMQPMIGERPNYQHNQDKGEGGSNGFPRDAKNAIDRTVGSRGGLGLSGHITSDQRFDHSVHGSTAFPFPVLNPVGQSQPSIPSHIQEVLLNSKDTLSAPRNSAINSDIGESKSGLPESLAQIMENGHLPRLFAVALSSQNVLSVPPPPFIKSEGLSDQFSNVQPDAAIFSQKPSSNTSACIGPNSMGTTSVDVKLEKASDDKHQISYSVGEPKRKSHEPDGSNKVGIEVKAEAANESPENGHQEVTDKDGADKGKKLKEAKEIRAFKFALAEFVKDLMKPSWKDGKVGKDAYKTIVKKVVDKVTGTIPGANIPQTQEKIDSYLSSSKPKLIKLVQAYVEKMQKS